MKFKIKRVVAFIADLHFGSPYAMWPEGFETDTGHPIPPGKGQILINQYFEDFKEKCNEFGVDTVISMAELIDGNNRKEYGRDRMTAEIDIQTQAAKQHLESFLEGRDFYGVSGSPYHNSLDTDAERMVVESLGGTFWGPIKNIKLKKTNIHCNICHGKGGNYIYRGTLSDKQLMFVKLAEAEKKINFHIDLFVRGHLHFYHYLDSNTNAYLNCPCATDWIPYPPALGLYGRQIDLGWVVVMFSEDKIFPHKFLYPLPNIAQTPLEA